MIFPRAGRARKVYPNVDMADVDCCVDCGQIFATDPGVQEEQEHGCEEKLQKVDDMWPCFYCDGKLDNRKNLWVSSHATYWYMTFIFGLL